jgi:hypothetical protein
MVAGKKCGLKGGEVETSRPEPANINTEFDGILITQLAGTPKQIA